MEKIEIDLKYKKYNIFLDTNLLFSFKKIFDEIGLIGKNIYVLTDERVAKYHLSNLLENIYDYNVKSLVIKGYENAKSIETYEKVVTDLLEMGIKRSDVLVAFGGGVIGDLGGFVASSLFRGIDLVMIPTTLLSIIDSSVGGKVAINLGNHKNILGAFYQPKAVLIDPKFLDTLQVREYNNGIGEVIKYGAIKNKEILDRLIKNKKADEWTILECLKIKKEIVLKDELDKGERMILNFGHTFGHVIELNSKLLHGESISLGMLMAIKIGIKLGITENYVYDYIKEILDIFKLPSNINEYKNVNFLDIIYDKKVLSNEINFILIKDLGNSVIKPFRVEDLEEVISWI